MYCGCNKTALCSQLAIAESFFSLLKEKEYAKITASEICKKAGVSRQTFYSLFSSKENIVSFILLQEYAFNPSEECHCTGIPDLPQLGKGFASFIVQKGDFIRLLEKNNILHLMQESLYCNLYSCIDNTQSELLSNNGLPHELISTFIASGLTAIAGYYVNNSSDIDCDELESVICKLFSGRFL